MVKDDDIKELMSKLLEQLTKIHIDAPEPSHVGKVVLDDGDIEVDVRPGTPIKIDSKTYYRIMYADVNNLKNDAQTLLDLYLDDVKPNLKLLEDNISSLNETAKNINIEIETLRKNGPKSIKVWFEEKGKVAENVGNVIKFIFWAILILWILSTALPNIISFVSKAIVGQ